MAEIIGEVFSKIFGDNVIWATIIVSMVPIMELKGGIPFGMSKAFWGGSALTKWQAFWSAYLGSSLVVVVLYFVFVPIMNLLRKTKLFKRIANWVDGRIDNGLKKINKDQTIKVGNVESAEVGGVKLNVVHKDNKLGKMLGVLGFVAIPLPLTGVWIGTCLSVVLGLNFWQTFVCVQVGNFIAGIIISTICVIFPQFTHWLIYIFLILVIIVIIAEIIKNKILKNKK